ncbi:MAG: adenylyltransferase/cytidyltransferase family protein [Chloroflexi bacterium]|nr:adenylyltransferase/cytidyltransferase family protein [Chloroflexota bacterium]
MSQILSLPEAVRQANELRGAGKLLVFTNGVFDLLHAGHLDYLEAARALGDALFVGLNSDDSARGLRGLARPFLPAPDRARLLAALRAVDAVIPFPEPTAVELVRALRPAIYVKGGDYAHKGLPERPAVEGYGGRVVLLPLLPGRSTSELIERIQRSVKRGA